MRSRLPDPMRRRALRALILEVAHLAAAAEATNPDDPYTLSRNVLVQTLENAGALPANEELRSAVRYLEEKGAVKARWRLDGSGEFDSFRLLALGIDLAEGTASDPGITFARRRD